MGVGVGRAHEYYIILLLVREIVRGMKVVRSNRDELREREVREDKLPLAARLPSRGDPGSKEVAAPL